MPKFETEDWGGCKFTVPDKPSVWQVVAYDSARLEHYGQPDLLVLWEMAKTLIQDWASEALPDFKVDLQKVEDVRAASLIEWASLEVSIWRRRLDDVPKNS